MGFIKNINHFANEVRYRATSGTTPPFFKKLAKIGAMITGAGTAFAFVPGGLIIGAIAAGVGLGLSGVAILGTKDSAEVTEAKANLQAAVRKEKKEAEKQSLKTNDKNETNP